MALLIAVGKLPGGVIHVPVEWRRGKHALGRTQADRARIIWIEYEARHLELVGQPELRRLLERVGEVAAGIRQRNDLRLGGLRLQKERGEIRCPERNAGGSQNLAAKSGDLFAGARFEVLSEGVIGGDEVPAVSAPREHRLGNAVAELPRVV